MEFMQELKSVISEMNLEFLTIELETTPEGRIGGYITSSSFEGKTQIERQNMIWSYLDQNLEEEKKLRIVALLTLTPEEADEAKTSS